MRPRAPAPLPRHGRARCESACRRAVARRGLDCGKRAAAIDGRRHHQRRRVGERDARATVAVAGASSIARRAASLRAARTAPAPTGSATCRAPPSSPAAPARRRPPSTNGRANASASSSSAVDPQRRAAAARAAAAGAAARPAPCAAAAPPRTPRRVPCCRRSRCRTIGIADASAPSRNSGERKDRPGHAQNARAPRGQVGHQRHLERLRGVEQLVVDAGQPQLAPVALDAARRSPSRYCSRTTPAPPDLFARLEVLEPRRPLERETQLRRIEHVEDDDVGAAEPEMLQPAITRSGSSSRSEISTTMPRLRIASASWCSGLATLVRVPERRADRASPAATRRWPGRALGRQHRHDPSSKAVRPTASRCRFIR